MPLIVNGNSIASVILNQNILNGNIIVCKNIEELKKLNIANEGVLIKTLGYYELGDGGGAEYLTRDTSYKTDNILDITLDNGIVSQRLLTDNKVNVLTLGIKKKFTKN